MKPVPSEFDEFAKEYDDFLFDPIRDRFSGRSAEFFHKRKLELLLDGCRRRRLEPGRMRWLDVGCGRGELLRMGKPYFGSVAGCDVSAEMLKESRDVDIRQQSAPQELPFPNQAFHVVTAVCVYHHVLPEVRQSLTGEIYRVLQPGGLGCIIEHNPWNPVTRLIVKRSPIDVDAKLLSVLTARRLLGEAGLIPMDAKHFLYFPARLYSRLRVIEGGLRAVPLGGQYAVFARRPA